MQVSMLEEKWQPLKGFEGRYAISSWGRVKRLEGFDRLGRKLSEHVLSPWRDTYGYLCIEVGSKNLRVHRVAALAFLGEPPKNWIVHHKDGNKENNTLNNLEYSTYAKNTRETVKQGRHNPTRGEDQPSAVLTNEQVRFIRESYLPIRVLARKFNVARTTIKNVLIRRTWRHIE